MTLSPKYPDWPDSDVIEYVVGAYTKKQCSLDFISEKTGIPKHSVRRILLRQNVELRPAGRPTVIDDATLRRCGDCGATYPVRDFPRDRTKPGGRGYRCKGCNRARNGRVYLND